MADFEPILVSSLPDEVDAHTIYVTISENKQSLIYRLKHPSGSVITAEIVQDDMKDCPFQNIRNTSQLTPFLNKILQITAARGHTIIEEQTLLPSVCDALDDDTPLQIGTRIAAFPDPTDPSHMFASPSVALTSSMIEDTSKNEQEIVFVVDMSGSMKGAGQQTIATVLPIVFERLAANTLVSLFSFDDKINEPVYYQVPKSTIDALTFKAQCQGLTPGNMTALFDALLSKSVRTIKNPNNALVVVLTDGVSNAGTINSVDSFLPAYQEAFNDKAATPRLITIGLGDRYSPHVLTKLAEVSNTGLIDARDQKRLSENLGYLYQHLTCGAQVTLDIAGDKVHFGHVAYNSACKTKPYLFKTEDFNSSSIQVAINKMTPIAVADAVTMPNADEQKAIISNYVTLQVESIEKGPISLLDKFQQIQAMYHRYEFYLRDVSRLKIRDVLIQMERELFYKNVHAHIIQGNRAPFDHFALSARFETLIKEGTLRLYYPEEQNGLIEFLMSSILALRVNQELNADVTPKISLTTGKWILESKTHASVVQQNAYNTANYNTSTGVSTLSSFQAYLGGCTKIGSLYRVNRNVNFIRVAECSTVPGGFSGMVSQFLGREDIFIAPHSVQLEDAYQKLYARLMALPKPLARSVEGVIAILGEHFIEFVRASLPLRDLTQLTPTDTPHNPYGQINIDQCLETGVGVCRHHSILTATLLGMLLQRNAIFGGMESDHVTHYRAATRDLRSHSLVIYYNKAINTYYLIDTSLNLIQKVANQNDFNACVKRYNQFGLPWILKNFAADYQFDYPAESYVPFPEDRIQALLALAVTQPDLSHALQAMNGVTVSDSDSSLSITQSEDNEADLWRLFMKHYCFSPEEVTDLAQDKNETFTRLRTEGKESLLERQTPITTPSALISEVSPVATVLSIGSKAPVSSTNARVAPPHTAFVQPTLIKPAATKPPVVPGPAINVTPRQLPLVTHKEAANTKPVEGVSDLDSVLNKYNSSELRSEVNRFTSLLNEQHQGQKITKRELELANTYMAAMLNELHDAKTAGERQSVFKKYQNKANAMQGHPSKAMKVVGGVLIIAAAVLAALVAIIMPPSIILIVPAAASLAGLGIFGAGYKRHGVSKEFTHVLESAEKSLPSMA